MVFNKRERYSLPFKNIDKKQPKTGILRKTRISGCLMAGAERHITS